MEKIVVKGAREHNLKNITVEIPRDKIVVITGPSGSGKSTLAFDTLYAEGQRRYVESLSAYARQFIGLMNKSNVDSIDGLSPAISIDQKTTSKNPRSTVGTVTEIYDYFRLLFARIGTLYCPDHNIKIEAQSAQKIASKVSGYGWPVTILSPIVRQKKGTYEKLISDLNKEGYSKVRVNKKIHRTDEKISLERYKKHDIEIVIDNISEDDSRLAEACESALKKSNGLLISIDKNNKETLHSANLACPVCGIGFEELQPRMFSFNSPFGACDECNGLGIKMDFEEDLIIPDKAKSIVEGAIAIYKNAVDGWRAQYVASVAKHFGFNALTPIKDLTKVQYDALMYGSSEKIKFSLNMKNGEANWSNTGTWEGLVPQSERLYHLTESDYRRKELEKYMRITDCLVCSGNRLKKKALAVKISGKSIADLTNMPIDKSLDFFKNLSLSKKDQSIAKEILKEITSRLSFLNHVGLSYLTLSRNSGTLSGGEAQRIRLANQIGSNLMGVLYILDEPSIGLHQRDNEKLIETLQKLRNLGNTLVVVEHDEDTIRNADHIIDMGPGSGIHGGKITAQGSIDDILKNKKSLTGRYLSKKLRIEIPKKRRKVENFIRIEGCNENNLKNINVKIPLGLLTLVTGVSGSGKSTLIYEILYKGLSKKLYNSKIKVGNHKSIVMEREVDKVIIIDQSPIGRTPRSNPATYTKVFDEIRKLFAETQEAKLRGYKSGRFSFNVKGGRCENCEGGGEIKIEMNFLPDVYIECEECKGKRYNKETLDVKYKEKSIADILDMSIEEAYSYFENIPSVKSKLLKLMEVGLDYVKLGQSSITLSGGEAQRIKLTRELSKKATGKTVYLLDEPTTGLHFDDCKKLIKVLQDLVDKNNTVIVIEHNLDIIKSADYIIDLGPEGGNDGGEVVATGSPEEIVKNKKSHTAKFLKGAL